MEKCPACAMTSEDVERLVSDQDLRNALGSVLEFAAEGFRITATDPTGADGARTYLRSVAADIISGKGHPAPADGPAVAPSSTGTLG